MELIEINYKGIKVDKCSGCEGVWLDAGELEAISQLEKLVVDKFYRVFYYNIIPKHLRRKFLRKLF